MKNKMIYLLLFTLLLATFTKAHHSQAAPMAEVSSTTVYGSVNQDAYVESGYPTAAVGANQRLYLGYDTWYGKGYTRIYAKFNLPSLPVGARIDSAEAQLYQYTDQCSSSYGVTAYEVTSGWDEMSITWNNQPTVAGGVGAATFGCSAGWKAVSITSMVRDWYGGQANEGINLRASSESSPGGVFFSKSCTSSLCPSGQYPRLKVTYSIIAPSAPSLSSPSNGSSTCDSTPTFDWSAVSSATSYRIQVDDSSSFSSPAIDTTTANSGYTPSSALPAKTYYWRVNATNSGGASSWSATRSVTLKSAPAAPVLTAPANGAVIDDTTPTLNWNAVTGATSYIIQADDSPSFASLEVDASSSGSEFTPATALADGLYHWRVRGVNACGSGAWSQRSFTIDPLPDAPLLSSPSDGIDTCDTTPSFAWSAADGATSYGIQVADDSSFSSPQVDATVAGSSYVSETDLTAGTYYWRVRGVNSNGSGPWSTIRSFSIQSPPAKPNLITPSDDATIGDTSPSFSWESVVGATGYTIEVSDSSDFATPIIQEDVSENAFTPVVALATESYHWRTQASNVCGLSEWSDTWQFDVRTPELRISEQIAANASEPVVVPVHYTSNGQEIASVVFSVDLDTTNLSFDPTDSDGDGIPDAVVFDVAAGFSASAAYDVGDSDGELDVFIADTFPPFASLADGDLIRIMLEAGAPAQNTDVPIRFSRDPRASFGSTSGSSVSGSTSDGSVLISITASTPPAAPVLNAISNADQDGAYTASWTATNGTHSLEEAAGADFSTSTIVYTGSGTFWSTADKAPGDYYYRVRTCNDTGCSNWSNTVSTTVFPSEDDPTATLYFDPQTSSGNVGSALTMDIALSGIDNLGSYEFGFHYEPEIVSVDEVNMGSFPESSGRDFTPLTPIIDAQLGKVTFGAYSMGIEPAGPSGAGALATVKLSLLKPGQTTLAFDSAQVATVSGDSIAVGTSGGSVTVSNCTGDFDGDGDVDIIDLQKVAYRWNAHAGDTLYDATYDLDGDGDTDILDIQKVAYRWGTQCGGGLSTTRATETLTPTETGFKIPSRTIVVGDTFTVGLVLSDVTNLGAFELTASYDGQLMEVLTATLGTFPESSGRGFTMMEPKINTDSDTITLGAYSQGSTPAGAAGTGQVAILTLKALAAGNGGFRFTSAQVADVTGESQPVAGLASDEVIIGPVSHPEYDIFVPLILSNHSDMDL